MHTQWYLKQSQTTRKHAGQPCMGFQDPRRVQTTAASVPHKVQANRKGGECPRGMGGWLLAHSVT